MMLRLEDLGIYLAIVVALGNLAIVLLRRAGYDRAADVLGQIVPLALSASKASTWREALRALAVAVLAGAPDAEAEARKAIASTRPPPRDPPVLPVLLIVLCALGCGGASTISRGLEDVRDRMDEARPGILLAAEIAKSCAASDPRAAAVVEDMIARLDLVWESMGTLLCAVVEDKTGCGDAR